MAMCGLEEIFVNVNNVPWLDQRLKNTVRDECRKYVMETPFSHSHVNGRDVQRQVER